MSHYVSNSFLDQNSQKTGKNATSTTIPTLNNAIIAYAFNSIAISKLNYHSYIASCSMYS